MWFKVIRMFWEHWKSRTATYTANGSRISWSCFRPCFTFLPNFSITFPYFFSVSKKEKKTTLFKHVLIAWFSFLQAVLSKGRSVGLSDRQAFLNRSFEGCNRLSIMSIIEHLEHPTRARLCICISVYALRLIQYEGKISWFKTLPLHTFSGPPPHWPYQLGHITANPTNDPNKFHTHLPKNSFHK